MSNSNRKLGLLPGSVVYTGENPNYNITVTVIYYSKTFHKRVVFSADDKIDIDLEFDGNIWINIDGINDVGLIKRIGKIFNIDSLSLEDIANPEQRVKIDDRDSYIHIILKMLQMELLTKDVQYEQMSLIIKDNILITFQETPYDLFESIRSRLENPRTKLASKDVSYLAYILIDTIVDNYLLILDEVETEIDDIENKLVESADREDLENILTEPKHAIFKQLKELVNMYGVELEFDNDTIHTIAKLAYERKTGARALRSVCEALVDDKIFEITPKTKKIKITKEDVEKKFEYYLKKEENE